MLYTTTTVFSERRSNLLELLKEKFVFLNTEITLEITDFFNQVKITFLVDCNVNVDVKKLHITYYTRKL